MNLKIPAIYLFTFLAAAALAANEAEQPVRIPLDTIEAMVYREQFAEALLPLANVPSPDRSPRWRKLVEQAAAGHLRTMMREAPAGADTVGEVLLKDYPYLSANPEFMNVYTQVIRSNAEACLERGGQGFECAEKAHRMLKSTARDGAFYLEFAELFDKRVGVAVAIPFLQLSEEKGRKKGCASDVARRILAKGFALPPGEPKSAVLAVAETYCKETSRKVLTGLSAKNPYVKQALCAFSVTKGNCRVPAKQ